MTSDGSAAAPVADDPRVPLAGIRVISLEQYIAGPHCSSILAALGAEVVKVEMPPSGDPRRSYPPVVGGVSGGFASYNRGKKSVTVDLDTPAGVEAFEHLLSGADVLLVNLRPGALDRRGWTAESLRTDHPGLIVCEITGFGTTGGPYGGWPAFDSVIQAMSGLSDLVGEAGGAPGSAPMSSMDLLAGTWAALGVLAGLVGRSRTGSGVHVDAAMYDIAVSALERPLTLHEFTGEVPTRGRDDFSPVGMFAAADGRWVSIVIPTDDVWARCCAAVADPELATDPRLDSVEKRSRNMRTVIVPTLESWALASGYTAEQAAATLRQNGQPAGVVQSIDEVRACDHLEHRGMFVPLEDADPDAAQLKLTRFPLLLDKTAMPSGAIPGLGSDNTQFGV